MMQPVITATPAMPATLEVAICPAFPGLFYLSFKSLASAEALPLALGQEAWTVIERLPLSDTKTFEKLFNLAHSEEFPVVDSSPSLRQGNVEEALNYARALSERMRGGRDLLGEYVYQQALALYENSKGANDLGRARDAFEYAFALGQIEAGFFAAQICEAAAARAGFATREGKQNLDQAEDHYRKCATAGLARAWVHLALLKEDSGNSSQAASDWNCYFEEFGEAHPLAQELDFLFEVLYQYFKRNAPSQSMTFLRNKSWLVTQAQRRHRKDPEFMAWLRACCWTKMDFILEQTKVPALALVGTYFLYLANPGLAYLLIGASVYLWYRLKKKKKKA